MNPELQNSITEIPVIIFGKVLQGGLGMGDLSRRLLEENIELVTIENNQEVIDAFQNTDERHTIILGDFNEYMELNKNNYQFIVCDLPDKQGWLKTDGWSMKQCPL